MLRSHQHSYEQIIGFFRAQPGKKLAILTSPPLIPILTLPSFAARARQLADWLAGTDLGPKVFVFDLFDELAAPAGKPQANMLRKDYRRHFLLDSHPNRLAAQTVAPKLAAFFEHIVKST